MIKLNCLTCGTDINSKDKRRMFCSSSCSAKRNNTTRTRIKKQRIKNVLYHTPSKYCEVCSMELKKYQSRFCTRQCSAFKKRNDSKNRLLTGSEVSSGVRRKILIDLLGYKCQICDNTEWMGHPIPLVMDHINGNASDNSLDNFRLICSNCDRLSPFYGSKNRGRGRKSLGLIK